MLEDWSEDKFCKKCLHDERLAKTGQCDCRICIWNECGIKIRNKM